MKKRKQRILSGRVFKKPTKAAKEERVFVCDDAQAALQDAILAMIRNGYTSPGVSFIPAERDGARAVLLAVDSAPGDGTYRVVAEMLVSHFTMSKYKSFAENVVTAHGSCGCLDLPPDRALTPQELERAGDILRLLIADFAYFHSTDQSFGMVKLLVDQRGDSHAEMVIVTTESSYVAGGVHQEDEMTVPLVEVLPTVASRNRYREIGPRTYVTLTGDTGAEVIRYAPIVVLS